MECNGFDSTIVRFDSTMCTYFSSKKLPEFFFQMCRGNLINILDLLFYLTNLSSKLEGLAFINTSFFILEVFCLKVVLVHSVKISTVCSCPDSKANHAPSCHLVCSCWSMRGV